MNNLAPNKRINIFSSDFSDRDQGIWILIPAKNQKNVFFIRNKLSGELLFAVHSVNKKKILQTR
jgi:hypothetical protein